jgi:hypothetical protein
MEGDDARIPPPENEGDDILGPEDIPADEPIGRVEVCIGGAEACGSMRGLGEPAPL